LAYGVVVSLVAIGLNHRTAPLELRERVAKSVSNIEETLNTLQVMGITKEVTLLSTCNRVEIYGVLMEDSNPNVLLQWLGRKGGFQVDIMKEHFYTFQGKDVLHHLFRVVSSLDSMILGENQIVSQLKEAYKRAVQMKSVGPILRRTMDRALIVAKRVRTETSISKESVSIGHSGVDLASQVLGSLNGRSALLIGAGEHGTLVAKNLISKGLTELIISNRTFARAADLAEKLSATAIHINDLERYLARVDIVLASVGGGEILLSKDAVRNCLRPRGYKPIVLIDLSIPRVIEPKVHDIDDAYLFDIDDLSQLAHVGAQKRRNEAVKVEEIVNIETSECWKMLQDDQRNSDIGEMFKHADGLRETEVKRLFESLDELSSEQRKAIELMSKTLVKRMLHNPVNLAHKLAREEQSDKLNFLFQAILGDLHE
jgi:glutamyl-tRNA reductase